MITILQIRETPLTRCAGIDANCQGLIQLFSADNQIYILPTIEYTRYTVPIINQFFLDKNQICNSIEKYKPDIIHIHGAYSFTLLVAVRCALKFNKPIAFSPHFHPFWSLRRPIMGNLFFYLITKPILKHIDTVFTINNEDTCIFSKYHKNVVKIPHWSKFDRCKSVVKKKYNMILFVGRPTDSIKGFEHLYYLPEGRYEIHCVGKGDIKRRSDIIQHINISDEELKILYQQAALLVVPSRYEAFSFVAIEALLCNTPILVSNRVRIIDHLGGIKGYSIFIYHDFDAFSKKVEETIGEEVDIKAVSEIFSSSEIRDIYKSEYLRIKSIF